MDPRIGPTRATTRRPLDRVPTARHGPGRRTGHRAVLGRLVRLPRPPGDPPRHPPIHRHHRLTRHPTRCLNQRPLIRRSATDTRLRPANRPTFDRCCSALPRLTRHPRPAGWRGGRRRRRQSTPPRPGPCSDRLPRRRRTHPRRRPTPRRRPHHPQPRPPSHRRRANHRRPTRTAPTHHRIRRDYLIRPHRTTQLARQPQHRNPRPVGRPPRRRPRTGPANPRLPHPERPLHHHRPTPRGPWRRPQEIRLPKTPCPHLTPHQLPTPSPRPPTLSPTGAPPTPSPTGTPSTRSPTSTPTAPSRAGSPPATVPPIHSTQSAPPPSMPVTRLLRRSCEICTPAISGLNLDRNLVPLACRLPRRRSVVRVPRRRLASRPPHRGMGSRRPRRSSTTKPPRRDAVIGLPRRRAVSRPFWREVVSRLTRGCWCRPARAGSRRFCSSGSARLPVSSPPPSR